MKKRNLISVILVVALLLSCSLSVFAAVPPKGETAEPQYASVICDRCFEFARVLSNERNVHAASILFSDKGCQFVAGSHTHDQYRSGVFIDCSNCGQRESGVEIVEICNKTGKKIIVQ